MESFIITVGVSMPLQQQLALEVHYTTGQLSQELGKTCCSGSHQPELQ